ncbi:MAG: hypothetical protein ABWZ25_16650 [Chitinophagaceae bacterium]
MKITLLFLVMMAGLAACNNSADTPNTVDPVPDTSAKNDPAPTITTGNTPVNVQVDSLIRFMFDRDSSTLTATGTLGSARDRITGYLSVDKEVDLTAMLFPDDKGLNIRFTQIVLPDGKTDGPFGQTLRYKLTQPGTYQLIIGPSNMADGKVKGDFTIRLGVTPNPHE